MANARRQEASSRIKKAYSALSQACLRAKAMGNDWEEWADTASDEKEDDSITTAESFAKQYLLPYLNYTDTAIVNNYFYVYLNDGSYFSFHKGSCLDFLYDINGLKKPNESGKDIFDFLYCPYSNQEFIYNARVIPYLYKKTNREDNIEICKNKPWACSGLLAIDNWEFKKDYPYNI